MSTLEQTIVLESAQDEKSYMSVSSSLEEKTSIAISFDYDGESVSLSNGKNEDVHLMMKSQVGYLIDFLKRAYEDMEHTYI
jgi:hypothetical protein